MFRLVLHKNLNTFGSPASTTFRSTSHPTTVALTVTYIQNNHYQESVENVSHCCWQVCQQVWNLVTCFATGYAWGVGVCLSWCPTKYQESFISFYPFKPPKSTSFAIPNLRRWKQRESDHLSCHNLSNRLEMTIEFLTHSPVQRTYVPHITSIFQSLRSSSQ